MARAKMNTLNFKQLQEVDKFFNSRRKMGTTWDGFKEAAKEVSSVLKFVVTENNLRHYFKQTETPHERFIRKASPANSMVIRMSRLEDRIRTLESLLDVTPPNYKRGQTTSDTHSEGESNDE